ncbi:MAG: twin-arginine translocase subunit TatC [Thermodesulfovibrionia bacterium]
MDKQPLTAHLEELRKRILISVVAIFVGFIGSFYFSESIFKILTFPMHSTLRFSLNKPFLSYETKNTDISLVFLAPAEALWMHFKISLISGVILASPIIFYQVWRFVSPGLVERERRFALPFVITTSFLFLIGSLFCFLIVLPFAINFLLTYKTENIKPMISVGKYMDFCLKFILAFGAIFELPVVVVFLTRMGIVTTDFLSKNRKYAIVIAFVLAAILTPTPDAFNQTLMAGPIIFLYEIGIIASRIFNRKREGAEKDGNAKG